jgi:cobyrinic acid a,c-diamide synthase
MPERHLGLVQATEIDDIEQRLTAMAVQLSTTDLVNMPLPEVCFDAPQQAETQPLLAGKTIAIAKDSAFSFLYQANIDCLNQLGASLRYFSPLANDALPDCDAVYLPGGYPELHLTTLSQATQTKADIHRHLTAQKPLLAECGGLLVLLDTLTDKQGATEPMWGLVQGNAVMQQRFAALGMQSMSLPEGTLHGHTFHYSKLSTHLTPIAQGINPYGKGVSESAYRIHRLTASYMHSYFPSNPTAVARLFSSTN